MDYRKTAQDILDHVGGSKNIASAAHCATRLRLVIADNKKVSRWGKRSLRSIGTASDYPRNRYGK